MAYTYNKAGETLTADNTGPDSSAIASYTYTYTTTGNVQTEHVALAAMSNGVTLAADYDYNNNMTTLAANINSGSVTPTFNSDGTISFSGGVDDFENTYFYDTLGDMTGIEQIANPNTGDGASSHNDVQAKNVAMSYDSDERLTGVDMYQSDGTSDLVSSAAYGYDADSDLTSLTYYANTAHTGTPLAGYHWDCNAAGVVSDEYSRNDSSDGSSAADTYGSGSDWGKTAYTYDPTAQLTAATYTSFSTAQTAPANYSADYDPNGNRTSNTGADGTGTSSTAEASSTNRLLFDGTYYYLYDAEGNRIAQYVNTYVDSDTELPDKTLDCHATDITIYTWNNANELTGATHYNNYSDYEAGTCTATNEYAITYGNDAFGQMVTRTAAIGTGTSAPSTTENFIYNGQNIALVLDQYGNVIERELTGTAADQVFASESVVSGFTNWYLTDNQGTVRDVEQFSDSSTTNVDHLVYGAFGQLTAQSASSASDQPTFYFNGTWQDPQTGLNKMGLRWYDAVDSVFASYDPIGFNGGQTNLSEFVGDSPTNFGDPSGMAEQEWYQSTGWWWLNPWSYPIVRVVPGALSGLYSTEWEVSAQESKQQAKSAARVYNDILADKKTVHANDWGKAQQMGPATSWTTKGLAEAAVNHNATSTTLAQPKAAPAEAPAPTRTGKISENGASDAGDALPTASRWTKADGSIDWPPNDGFAATPEPVTLQPGDLVDRYGYPGGHFASPEGIPAGQRSLAPGTLSKPLHVYRVVKPINALGGKAAPWFDQPGGGMQYQFTKSFQQLLDEGAIQEVK